MSEIFYRVLHFVALFFFIAGTAAAFWGNDRSRGTKIVTGVASLLILVAGMGLIARSLGLSHAEGMGWPGWLQLKMFLWLALAVAVPILSKKMKSHRRLVGYLVLGVMFGAVMLVVLKPF